MTKHRIREETCGLSKRFVVEQKGWFFWRDTLKYDTAGRKFLLARFFTLQEAKCFVKSKRKWKEKLNNPPEVKVTYHTDI